MNTRTSKIDSVENADEKLGEWVSRGLSLKQIAAELAKLGVQVTDMTVLRRCRSLGLELKRNQVAAPSGAGPWLSRYREDIVRLADAGETYVAIWDYLTAHNAAQPQFQRDLSNDAKSSAIAAWVHGERKRVARRSRTSLLDVLTPSGGPEHFFVQQPAAVSGARPAPQRATRAGPSAMPRAATAVLATSPPAVVASESSFDFEERRRETEALKAQTRAAEEGATTAEQKAKAAAVLKRLGQA